MSTKRQFTIWDPLSHEYLTKFNAKRPKASRWKFLEGDVYGENEVQTFPSQARASKVARVLLRDTLDELDQLEIREVEAALAETGRFIPRIDNPLG